MELKVDGRVQEAGEAHKKWMARGREIDLTVNYFWSKAGVGEGAGREE